MDLDAIDIPRALRVLARQIEYFDGDVNAAIHTLKSADKDRIDVVVMAALSACS